MGHPLYVYTPRTPAVRQRLREIHRERLGIPQGHCRIYGIHVPEKLEAPLRNYASWVNQKRGREAAEAFVRKAVELGKTPKVTPTRLRITERGYVYRPRPSTVSRRMVQLHARGKLLSEGEKLFGLFVPPAYADVIRPHAEDAKRRGNRLAAQWVILTACARGWPEMGEPKGKAIDWSLVDMLLDEHATHDEIAEFLKVGTAYFKAMFRAHRGGK